MSIQIFGFFSLRSFTHSLHLGNFLFISVLVKNFSRFSLHPLPHPAHFIPPPSSPPPSISTHLLFSHLLFLFPPPPNLTISLQ